MTSSSISNEIDVYDFESIISYPYQAINIGTGESFNKYDSGIAMNRGDMLFYEANGSIQFINNEVVLYYEPKGVVAKLSKTYVDRLNLGPITPFENLPPPPDDYVEGEELTREGAIRKFIDFYNMRLKIGKSQD